MAGTLSNPKTSSRYSTGKKKKDNKDKKGSLMVYSCGKNTLCATYSDYVLFKSPIANIASLNHLTYITHANNKSLKDAFAMCAS